MNELQFQIARFLAYKAQQEKRTTYQEVGEAIGWNHPTGRGLGNNLEVILRFLKDRGLPPLTTILVKKGERYPAEDAMEYIRNVLGDVDIETTQESVLAFDWKRIPELQSDVMKLPGGQKVWRTSFGDSPMGQDGVQQNVFLLKFDGTLDGPAGISRPQELRDWAGRILHMPWNGPRASSYCDKSPGPKIDVGDLLYLWTHEDEDFGSGYGLTGVATAKSVIEREDFLDIELGNLALLKVPFGFKILEGKDWTSIVFDRIHDDRGSRAWVVSLDEQAQIDQVILEFGSTTSAAKADADQKHISPMDRALVREKGEIARKEEERKLTLTKARPGQQRFRDEAMRRHNDRCVITQVGIPTALEAAHVIPHTGCPEFEVPENSLILRRDLHALFDAGLICIHSTSGKLIVAPQLKSTAYGKLEGRGIAHKLAPASLRYQYARFKRMLV